MSVPCSHFGTACQGLKGSVPAFTIMIHGQKNCLGPKLPCFLVVHIYMKICPEIKISAIFWSYLLLSGQHYPLPADPQATFLLPTSSLWTLSIEVIFFYKTHNFTEGQDAEIGTLLFMVKTEKGNWSWCSQNSQKPEFAGGIVSSEVLWQHSTNSYLHMGYIIRSFMKNLIRVLKLMAGNSWVWDDQEKGIGYLFSCRDCSVPSLGNWN